MIELINLKTLVYNHRLCSHLSISTKIIDLQYVLYIFIIIYYNLLLLIYIFINIIQYVLLKIQKH